MAETQPNLVFSNKDDRLALLVSFEQEYQDLYKENPEQARAIWHAMRHEIFADYSDQEFVHLMYEADMKREEMYERLLGLGNGNS